MTQQATGAARRPLVINFLEFFKTERDIWVQNIGDTQISLSFDSGGVPHSVTIPASPDPLNLSASIPWDALKSSMDLRKILNRQPKILKLLAQDEVDAYYEKKAGRAGTSAEEAYEAAEKRRQDLQNHVVPTNAPPKPAPIHRVIEDDIAGKKIVVSDNPMQIEDVINPRVLHICRQVAHDVPEEEKMHPREMIAQFEALNETALTFETLDYIQAHGHYKTVKTWAQQRIAALNAAPGNEGAPDPE